MKLRSVFLAAAALLPAPAWADGLVDNVTGLTLDKDGRVQRFQAMLVSPEDKISRL